MTNKVTDEEINVLLDDDYDSDSDISGISLRNEIEIEEDDGEDGDVVEEEVALFFDDFDTDYDDVNNENSYDNDNVLEICEVGQGDHHNNVSTSVERPFHRPSSDLGFEADNDHRPILIEINLNKSNEEYNEDPDETGVVRPSCQVEDCQEEPVNNFPAPTLANTSRGSFTGRRGRGRGRPKSSISRGSRPVISRGRGRGRGRPKRTAPKPNYNIGWERCDESDVPPVKHIYNDYPHFRPPLGKEIKNEIDYWQLFFTDELIHEITAETNRYAREKIQKTTPLQKRSIWHTWKDVTAVEMKAFLGVVINMAMHEKPEIRDYFSEDWLEKQPFFKDVFSRDRFFQIFWTLHLCAPVADTSTERTRTTRAEKIRRIGAYLDGKFREHYCPGPNISVDESTVGFKGKVVFKCYNKLKPIKWGLRIYVLSDSSNGYICALEPYFGSITTKNLVRPDLPFTVRIVLHLVHKLIADCNSTGLHVFTDRFYTSYILGQELMKLNMHLTGTIMPNRIGLPDAIKKNEVKDLQQHEVISLRKEESLVLVWRDKRNVTMFSTCCDNSSEKISRFLKSGVVEEVMKPKVILEYNKYMGGVDIADNYISSYGFTRKSLKWWRKLFFWLIETSIVNAYILYSMETEQPKRHRVFRKNLVRQLVGDVRNTGNRKRGRPSSLDNTNEVRLNGKFHALYKIEGGKTRDCKVCSDKKIPGGRREASTYCKTCPKEPALHVGQCFERYHTLREYK